ncbi:MAG: alpha/beta fold hydrolase [Deltaproteobacteria bacterium]|nr:alpha/beta fold hydrolase [Deltaproteobacteria bacterium]
MEEAVRVPCDTFDLEGRLSHAPAASLAVVVCHPHPKMGGDMHSPPVDWVRRALVGRGAAVLRFNFRGTGASGGKHGGGHAEIEDVAAALQFLAGHAPRARLALVGYSFGALVAARAAALREDLFALGLIAPPLARTRLPPLSARLFPAGLCVVAGTHDEFCPVEALEAWAAKSGAAVELLTDEDHFLAGARDRLERIFAAWLDPDAA